jgi:hypothetical protein
LLDLFHGLFHANDLPHLDVRRNLPALLFRQRFHDSHKTSPALLHRPKHLLGNRVLDLVSPVTRIFRLAGPNQLSKADIALIDNNGYTATAENIVRVEFKDELVIARDGCC